VYIQACGDVYVALAGFLGITDTSVYEVLLGGNGNREVAIRDGIRGRTLTSRDVTAPLHCTQSRWFWIDWSVGISLGSDMVVGDSELLVLMPADLPRVFDIYAVSIATGPLGGEGGVWEYTAAPGK